ncbi:MAG: sulfatase [Albidovulum sp.]|nr:sulfatase [Albidovulum sp.]
MKREGTSSNGVSPVVKEPNILIIFPDQMRYDCMSPSGNRIVKTPHLQRLADEGVTFDGAFASYPLCCPFRASLMTGKYAHGHGIYQNHFPLRANQEFLAERLGEFGYQTFYVGKWHLEGGPNPGFVPRERRFGFDRFAGFNRGHQYFEGVFWRDCDRPYRCNRFQPYFQTDHFIEFVDEILECENEEPFFGIVSYGPPHHPNDMPEYWRNMYGPAEVILPPGVLSWEEQQRILLDLLEFDCQGNMKAAPKSRCGTESKPQLEPETEDELRKFISEYYGMISCIDYNIGRILAHLESRGIIDDTLVIFLSDHGDMLGEHGYFCGSKSQGHRSAMQVPLIVRYPKRFAAGTRSEALVDVGIDTPVTLLELVGAKPLREADGVSFLPILDGRAEKVREAIMYQRFQMNDGARGEFTPVPERGIRTKEWLYVRQPERRKSLFDQEADPAELNNLVNDPSYAELMDLFDERINSHMEATGDDWHLHLDFPPENFLSHEAARQHLRRDLLPRAIAIP